MRGKGLMIGTEIVKDRTSKAPAADLTKKLSTALKDEGVIVGTTGVYGCVIRLKPPASSVCSRFGYQELGHIGILELEVAQPSHGQVMTQRPC